jgi:hypothetical protein
MISGLSLEYTQARIGARLAQRPDERLWQQVRSARSVPALLETVRASMAAPTVSGIPVTGDGDAIELAFRQQWRTRVDEVASWSPEQWRDAVAYTRFLGDLPALVHLLSDEGAPRWLSVDPELARYALTTPADRRTALATGPLASVAAAVRASEMDAPAHRDEPLVRTLKRLRAGHGLHTALAAWEREWRTRWPEASSELIAGMDHVAKLLRTHLLRFGSLPVSDALTTRQSLAARLVAHIRRAALQPSALFAYLALFALDLERLRGEFVLRARAPTTS